MNVSPSPESSSQTSPASTHARLAGKVAIVTGATQGLGADIARALANEGVGVLIAGLDVDAGHALAASIGTSARFARTDVTDDAQLDSAIATALTVFGGLDIVVNNACSYDDAGLASTREQWSRLLDVNLVSAAILAQKAAPHLRRRGVIVNLGSVGGKFGAAGRALYPASKAALLQLTRNLAVDLAPRDLRAISVSPAWTWSPSLERLAGGSVDVADRVGRPLHVLGRVGRGDEIGRIVAFLCSDDASWLTGIDVPVDGGFSILGPDQGRSPREWFERHAAQ
ncbi:SDR family oxidoreductase [Burkholderia cepacia]|uniref:SDR family oxidoreductase n=1 Tax=Burkholderia cepacia TaxID=292 RepID=A0AAX2RW44_BURCE|nr:SDR family oxidoreductase [Burkholderia cepacia]EMD9439888.1 SDR family oxidoreductase [Burkholderia cepacia]MCA7931348.1 SDR family oxidoreductase [Burkholderia cepacia]TES82237.1 SDR family oxidoreductase [Burkholderia cepacia]TET02697.1 SDR family oxidoreductase [Burkholderia cepacia]TEU45352.1 SDR family oxidoreductase [Burkholderia cepacia]